MEKIPFNSIIDFKRKSPRGQKTLAEKLKAPKLLNLDGGGDYWISALSAISNAFVENENGLIGDKIDTLIDKIENSEAKITKDMFQRNIDILYSFEDFDFGTLCPDMDLNFLKKAKEQSIVIVKRLPLYAKPNHVFTYEEEGIKKIGAIWFLARLGGLTTDELAIATDILFRYLNMNYGNKFEIATDFCLAMDVVDTNTISYTQIQSGEVKSTLLETLSAIRKLM